MLAALLPISGDAGPRVKFLSPTPETLAAGTLPIEVEVEPGSSPVVRVEIRVDGRLIAALVEPPYRLTWDAGEAIRSRRFQARAVDASGRSASAEVHSRALPAGEVVEVLLVTLYAAVFDPRGAPAADLRPDEFRILEDGIPQTIRGFSPDSGSLRIALLVDASRSMRGERIAGARRAAQAFLDGMQPEDRALVLAFDESLRVAHDWAGPEESFRRSLEAIEPGGGTALYDALHAAGGRLRAVEGRKGIVLLSDGRDESADGLGPGSLHTFEEAIETLQRADVTLYTIGLGPRLDRERDFTGRWSLAELLMQAAARTGGSSYFPTRPGRLTRIYEEISRDLRRQYRLIYYSTQDRRDGAWRKIDVGVARPGYRVRARAGYFAPGR